MLKRPKIRAAQEKRKKNHVFICLINFEHALVIIHTLFIFFYFPYSVEPKDSVSERQYLQFKEIMLKVIIAALKHLLSLCASN